MSGRRRGNKNTGGFGTTDPIFDTSPVAMLDLHHFAVTEVEAAVCNFLKTWQKRAPGAVVHIVTGKGRQSSGSPVLKPRVRKCLKANTLSVVKDWTRDLDDGGFLVLLSLNS